MTATPLFQVHDLHVSANETQILSGIDLTVGAGEVHVILGPDDSGTSTLANALLGSPAFHVTRGAVMLNGDDVTDWAPDVRAKQGMFLASSHPSELSGVTVTNLLHQAVSARRGEDQSVLETRRRILDWMTRLEMDPSFGERFLNEGFTTSERKRAEMLQLAMLQPDIAVLDETDSGADAIEIVARGVQVVMRDRPDMGVLAMTQHSLLVDLLQPDHVHVLADGSIVASGGMDLAEHVAQDGYGAFR